MGICLGICLAVNVCEEMPSLPADIKEKLEVVEKFLG